MAIPSRVLERWGFKGRELYTRPSFKQRHAYYYQRCNLIRIIILVCVCVCVCVWSGWPDTLFWVFFFRTNFLRREIQKGWLEPVWWMAIEILKRRRWLEFSSKWKLLKKIIKWIEKFLFGDRGGETKGGNEAQQLIPSKCLSRMYAKSIYQISTS